MDDNKGAGQALADSQAAADKAFEAQQKEAAAAELAKLNPPEPADREKVARELATHMVARIREIMYDDGKLQRMKVEDPGAIEEFWRLYDRMDEWLSLYMEGRIPRDTQWQYGVQAIPDGPKVKVLNIRPGDCLMDAVRDLFIYIALL